MMGLAGKLMAKPYASVSGLFVSAASAAANTVALPTHAAGDLIVVFLFNDNSATVPSPPSGGWTALSTSTSSAFQAYRIVYKFATSGSETLGTSTSATGVSATVYRGVNAISPFGNSASANTISQSYITYPSISTVASTSWIVLLAGCSASGAAILTTPSDATNRTTTVGGSNTVTANDTNAPVGTTTWAARNAAVNQVVSAMARSIELNPA